MTPQEAQTYLRPTVVIFYAMLVGQVMFLLVSYFLVYVADGSTGGFSPELHTSLQYVVPVLTAASVGLAYLLYQYKLKSVRAQQTLAAKLRGYQAAVVQRTAMLNGGAVFLIVSFMLTGLLYYVVLYAVQLAVFMLWRPSLQAAADDLQLDGKDRSSLQA
jgi:hypothetical protein